MSTETARDDGTSGEVLGVVAAIVTPENTVEIHAFGLANTVADLNVLEELVEETAKAGRRYHLMELTRLTPLGIDLAFDELGEAAPA